jgi:hypothetical protein
MGVGPIVGSDPGDPELLAQAVVRKTTLSPIASLIDLIWPAVIPDLFAMGNVHSNLRVLFWRLWSCFGLALVLFTLYSGILRCILRHKSETRKYL